jgi:hypothetical protein
MMYFGLAVWPEKNILDVGVNLDVGSPQTICGMNTKGLVSDLNITDKTLDGVYMSRRAGRLPKLGSSGI